MSTTTESGSVTAADGTGAGLVAFLTWTIDKNEMVEATASALRTGSQKVLAVEEGWQELDLRTADLDNIVLRFRNRHRLDMKDRTREQYEQRLRQSVDMYLKWLQNDPAWKPSQRKRAGRGEVGGSKIAATSNVRPLENDAKPIPAIDRPSGMISYPFPIRPGLRGSIELPEDLSSKEARRIAAFVATLAIDDDQTDLSDVSVADSKAASLVATPSRDV